MENNVTQRKVLFNKFVKGLTDNKKINLIKTIFNIFLALKR